MEIVSHNETLVPVKFQDEYIRAYTTQSGAVVWNMNFRISEGIHDGKPVAAAFWFKDGRPSKREQGPNVEDLVGMNVDDLALKDIHTLLLAWIRKGIVRAEVCYDPNGYRVLGNIAANG